jgi:glyoxylate/hydroxypyruvate reductase
VRPQFELFEGAPLDARYAVVWLPPPQLFAAERGLRAIFNVGACVEGLLATPGLPDELPVFRLVDAGMAPKMAEYVCFYVAQFTRGLARFVRHESGTAPLQDWNVDRPRGTPPAVAVLGLGAIGAKVALALREFGYPVRGWSRTPKSPPGIDCHAGDEALRDCLASAAIVVNVLPLTAATRDLLDGRRLSWLPRGALLINIGRGATIVDADLLAALDSGQVAHAVLDVFRAEPLPAGDPYWQHPQVTVTPHLSGPTPREQAAEQIAAAVAALEGGAPAEQLPGYVDRRRGY